MTLSFGEIRARVDDFRFVVFLLMTIDAEQFPVAAVGRIIVVIVILMMKRQLSESFAIEFPGAAGTDPGKQFESLITV